ncbi:MAG TPA: CDP-alcohol phosphatidyltransferase family protein [Candidatus Limnocylindrales bacterium]|nr:CDP-alcohol phosphatidyltransferase family protein [Candidatus Limnocylindrales bacterium]
MFTQKFQDFVRRWAERLLGVLRNTPITPNMLTVLGLLITAAGAAAIALHHLFIAGLILWFAGLFDIFDGALARASGRVYRYGAFFDSTVDRYSEGVVYLGMLIYFIHDPGGIVLVVLALMGSFLVSYVRARAQSLGFACDGGILARPERVVIIVAALILERLHIHPSTLTIALWILALGTNLTAVQRIWTVWRQNRAELRATEPASEKVPPLAAPVADSEAPMRAAMRRFFETWGKT